MGATISNLGALYKNPNDQSKPNSPGGSEKSESPWNSFSETDRTGVTFNNIDLKNRVIFTITDYIETLH